MISSNYEPSRAWKVPSTICFTWCIRRGMEWVYIVKRSAARSYVSSQTFRTNRDSLYLHLKHKSTVDELYLQRNCPGKESTEKGFGYQWSCGEYKYLMNQCLSFWICLSFSIFMLTHSSLSSSPQTTDTYLKPHRTGYLRTFLKTRFWKSRLLWRKRFRVRSGLRHGWERDIRICCIGRMRVIVVIYSFGGDSLSLHLPNYLPTFPSPSFPIPVLQILIDHLPYLAGHNTPTTSCETWASVMVKLVRAGTRSHGCSSP